MVGSKNLFLLDRCTKVAGSEGFGVGINDEIEHELYLDHNQYLPSLVNTAFTRGHHDIWVGDKSCFFHLLAILS